MVKKQQFLYIGYRVDEHFKQILENSQNVSLNLLILNNTQMKPGDALYKLKTTYADLLEKKNNVGSKSITLYLRNCLALKIFLIILVSRENLNLSG